MSEVLNKLSAEISEYINLYNQRLRENNFNAMNAVEESLKEKEAAYAEQSQREVFQVCGKAKNPILAAITAYTYPVIGHRRKVSQGTFLGFEKVTDRVKQLDLVDFCECYDLPTLWKYKVERMNSLLCKRVCLELGYSEDQIQKLERVYYLSDMAKKAELTGATPTSNTQMVKLLQEVIDAILFIEGDKPGMNSIRCNNRDIAYMLNCYGKRSNKRELTVTVAKTKTVHILVMDVMHRIVTGKCYGTDGYKIVADMPDAGTNPKSVVEGDAPITTSTVEVKPE